MKLFVPVHGKAVIQNEVPHKYRAKFIPIIENGYNLAKEATREISFLNWEIGRFHIGYLRPLAIQFLFKQSIENGTLPFKCKINGNSNNSAKHIEIHTDNAIITISQVRSFRSIARPAFFREKLQEANQLRIDFDNVDNNIVEDQPYYLLLTHGYGGEKPDFINLGMPDGSGWLDRINLLKEPRLLGSESVKEELITPEQLVGFRKFIQEVGDGEN